MKKQKYKAIVSDIDGTLTPIAPNSYPTDKATKHIKEAIDNGLIFTGHSSTQALHDVHAQSSSAVI